MGYPRLSETAVLDSIGAPFTASWQARCLEWSTVACFGRFRPGCSGHLLRRLRALTRALMSLKLDTPTSSTSVARTMPAGPAVGLASLTTTATMDPSQAQRSLDFVSFERQPGFVLATARA